MQSITEIRRGFFITGTDTEVGKTYVAALIAQALVNRKLRVGVYKPVASGCVQRGDECLSEDAEQLWLAAGRPQSLDVVTPQRFMAPLAPSVAARAEGQRVDSQLLREGLRAWNAYDVTIVEGVGGLMSPISDADLVIDLAVDFRLPLILVVANQLGCINQTLQTIDVAERRGLAIAAIVLNSVTRTQDASSTTNRTEIERWINSGVVLSLPWGETKIDLAPLQPWLP